VYFAELAPAKYRGARVGLFLVNVVIGILLAPCKQFLCRAVGHRPRSMALQTRRIGFACIHIRRDDVDDSEQPSLARGHFA
jgi:hypothetical protein